ncbi:hypothetical protein M8998_08115 [Sphingobacterium sp. lm-10]|uniref:hypothetical protein n=1 Tax=Sphingobacterium sp. lm-10 TaxID=2944904 RepID=UPI0020228053|nr:hypothetical protein [Sphingobacterium sp. lm-10]MCL7987901.1 hypothetical protein [Sphingobacterium sp. lm-10]
MSYSENDVLAKVGDLLVEINEEYAAVQEQDGEFAAIKFGMLAAKAKYLAAHLDLLSQLGAQKSDATTTSVKSASDITFTPATEQLEEEDNMPEIQGQKTLSNESSDNEEKTPEPEPEEEEPAVEEPEPEEEEPAVEEPKEEEEKPANQQAEAEEKKPAQTPKEEVSISEWRTSAEKNETEKQGNDGEAVVKSVIEESRTVEVSQPERKEPEAPAASSRPLTLNEMIQQQRRAGLTNANQFKTPASKTEQIVDLKTAVSLNDKLLFIKDLFNGYSLAYTEAIELLNRFDNMAEADAFLQANYSLKNNWASKPQTVEKLYYILQKKFS